MRSPAPYDDVGPQKPAHHHPDRKGHPMTTTTANEAPTVGRRFQVLGMSCAHCEHAIEAAVATIEGVGKATADATAGILTIESAHELDVTAVADAIDEAGYELVR